MENAWRGQRPPILLPSNSVVASSSSIPSQLVLGPQLEANKGHHLQVFDAWRHQYATPVVAQESHGSSLSSSNFSHPEIGTPSFPVLQSGLPSDSQQLTNRKTTSACFLSSASISNCTSIPKWPNLHDSGSSAVFPSTVLGGARRSVDFLKGGYQYPGTERALTTTTTTHAGFLDKMDLYVSPSHNGNIQSRCLPPDSSIYSDGMISCPSRVTSSRMMSFQNDQFPTVSRVFCMNKCGDLKVSYAGLLAVVCSCHGQNMSVSNFCEHSGLLDHSPGYAVHTDTGETIANWRKSYFPRLRIRIPGDQEGWEWPRGISPTFNCSGFDGTSCGETKNPVLSESINLSAEPLKLTHLKNNNSVDCLHSIEKHAPSLPHGVQVGNGSGESNLILKGWYLNSNNCQTESNNSLRSCAPSINYAGIKEHGIGRLGNNSWPHPCSFDMSLTSHHSFVPSLHYFKDVGTRTDMMVNPDRGTANSSSIDLKLGQPSQQKYPVDSSDSQPNQVQTSDHLTMLSQRLLQKTSTVWNSQHHRPYPNLHGVHNPWGMEEQNQIDALGRTLRFSTACDVHATGVLNDISGRKSMVSSSQPQPSASAKDALQYGPANIPDMVTMADLNSMSLQKNGEIQSVAGLAIESPTTCGKTSFRPCAKNMKKPDLFQDHGDSSHPSSCASVGGKSNLLHWSNMEPYVPKSSIAHGITKMSSCSVSSGKAEAVRPILMNSSLPQELLTVISPGTAILPAALKPAALCENITCDVQQPMLDGGAMKLASLESNHPEHGYEFLRLKTFHRDGCDPDEQIRRAPTDLVSSERDPHDLSIANRSIPSEVGLTTFSSVLGFEIDHGSRNKGAALGSKKDQQDPPSNELRLLGNRNEAAPGNVFQSSDRRESDNCVSKHCVCVGNGRCLDKGLLCHKGNFIGCVKQLVSTINDSEAAESASQFKKDSIPTRETVLCEHNAEVIRPMNPQSKPTNFKGMSVPKSPKESCKSMHSGESQAGGSQEQVQSEVQLVDSTDVFDPTYDHVVEGPHKTVFSSISSECSAIDITPSPEVNAASLCSVDSTNGSGLAVDQGSATGKLVSSDDAVESERSCKHPCSTIKIRSFDKHPSRPHISSPHSGSDCDEYFHHAMNKGNGMNWSNRKRRTKWRSTGAPFSSPTFSFSPPKHQQQESTTGTRRHHLFNKGPLHHHLKDCFDIGDSCQSLYNRQRKSSRMQSGKRDFDRVFDPHEENSNLRPLNTTNGARHVPNYARAKRLKLECSTKAAKEVASFSELQGGYKSRSLGCLWSSFKYHKKPQNWKKPIVCGMYGVLSGGENFLRPPKIFTLSRVLKSAEKCVKGAQHSSLKGPKTMSLNSVSKRIGNFFADVKLDNGELNRVSLCNDRNQNRKIEMRGKMCVDNLCSTSTLMSDKEVNHKVTLDGTIPSCSFSKRSRRKQKATCRRSLYELSMEGKNASFVNLNVDENLKPLPAEQHNTKSKAENHIGQKKQLDGLLIDKSQECSGRLECHSVILDTSSCCVCGSSNHENTNRIIACAQCSIRIHQGCYGVSKIPKGQWYCRPCSSGSSDMACVLCGYGGGAMTGALRSVNVVKKLFVAFSRVNGCVAINKLCSSRPRMEDSASEAKVLILDNMANASMRAVGENSLIARLLNPTGKQWVHMVCALWTPTTRCPNVDTMSTFDISGVFCPKQSITCSICRRQGGSCIRCRVETCSTHFHPWCAHQKGLLQSEIEGIDKERVGFYGRCLFHATALLTSTTRIASRMVAPKEKKGV